MKKNFLLLIVFALLITANAYSQMPPSPISSPVIDALMGDWISEPYDMMGMKMVDEINQKMILNGQFMQVDVTARSNSGFNYEAMGIISPNSDGTMSAWFYDVFGKDGMMKYNGTVDGTKITLTGSNDKMSETRIITFEGDKMIHNVTYKIKDESGNMMPDQSATITYRKK